MGWINLDREFNPVYLDFKLAPKKHVSFSAERRSGKEEHVRTSKAEEISSDDTGVLASSHHCAKLSWTLSR